MIKCSELKAIPNTLVKILVNQYESILESIFRITAFQLQLNT